MSQKIQPGDRISIDNLARELGVSQTPIRKALSRLEAQGLVVKTHLIGFSAASQMDRARLDQLYELRLLLEPFAAGKAAILMTIEQLDTLERICDKSSRNQSGETQTSCLVGPFGRHRHLNLAFHHNPGAARTSPLLMAPPAATRAICIAVRVFGPASPSICEGAPSRSLGNQPLSCATA